MPWTTRGYLRTPSTVFAGVSKNATRITRALGLPCKGRWQTFLTLVQERVQALVGLSGSHSRVRGKPSWLDMLSLQEQVLALKRASGCPARVRGRPSWLDMLSLQEQVTLIHCPKKVIPRVLRPLRHGPHASPQRLALRDNHLILQHFTARPKIVPSKEGPTSAVTPAENLNRWISPCLSRRSYGGIFGARFLHHLPGTVRALSTQPGILVSPRVQSWEGLCNIRARDSGRNSIRTTY